MIKLKADLIQALSVITFLPFIVYFLSHWPLHQEAVTLHFIFHISILLDLKYWN